MTGTTWQVSPIAESRMRQMLAGDAGSIGAALSHRNVNALAEFAACN